MFRPVPMQRVLLLVRRADLDAVLDAVGTLGVLHFLDLPGREEWQSSVHRPDVAEARRERLELLRRIDALLRFYEPPPQAPGTADPGEPAPSAVVVDAWTAEMDSLRDARLQRRETIDRLERTLRALETLVPTGLDLARLQGLRFLHAACGWVDERELPRLTEGLSHLLHESAVLDRRGGRHLLLLFGLARDRAGIERALRSVAFEPLTLPEAVEGPSAEAARRFSARLEEARSELLALEERFARTRETLAAPLAAARAATERELLRIEAETLTARSEAVAFVSGWIPAARVPALRESMDRVTHGRFHLRAEEPHSIDGVRRGREPVPILFRNPALVRPFEGLVASFGQPRFGELDPTPLVAVSFWVMFGLMFGDVGQGAAVAAAGWWIWRRMARHRDYAVILMECGLSSIVFGFAFGSFFGREDLIPALWFRPMEDVPRLLRFGAGFGLSFLSLAFALGVVNAMLRREWVRGVFSPQGLFAAATYWIAAALGLRWLATGEWGLGTGRVALLCGAPLALFWARVLWAELHEHGSPLLDAVLRSAVEVVDFVVRSIANTVSFVRLAAFAVSHAGLLVAVFALADAVGSSPAGNVLGVVVIVVGNLAIVALEGLIVSIQAVRLVYYEFFSKFYEGMGLEFRPLRLAPRGATEGRT